MKIVVLGASGGCGQQLTIQAHQRGHTVTAVVRSSTWQPPEGVKVVRGDLTQSTFLAEAIRGNEVVVSALGLRLPGLAPWAKPEQPDFLERSTPAVVAAMKAEGIRRLMAISAGGVGESRSRLPGAFRAMIALSALRFAYAELDKMEKVLLASGLDVFIPRPSGLTDGPITGQVKVATRYAGRATISRADLAGWMLDQLTLSPFPADRTPLVSVTGVA